jgi:hypothetical protein
MSLSKLSVSQEQGWGSAGLCLNTSIGRMDDPANWKPSLPIKFNKNKRLKLCICKHGSFDWLPKSLFSAFLRGMVQIRQVPVALGRKH